MSGTLAGIISNPSGGLPTRVVGLLHVSQALKDECARGDNIDASLQTWAWKAQGHFQVKAGTEPTQVQMEENTLTHSVGGV